MTRDDLLAFAALCAGIVAVVVLPSFVNTATARSDRSAAPFSLKDAGAAAVATHHVGIYADLVFCGGL